MAHAARAFGEFFYLRSVVRSERLDIGRGAPATTNLENPSLRAVGMALVGFAIVIA